VPTISYQPLATALIPLANKFYKSQRSNMRVARNAHVWTAQQDSIIAACCLKPLEHGHWLTSLLVAQNMRQQGIASALLEQLLNKTDVPVWLFCHPDLVAFYQRQGFQLASWLPSTLTERLQRYRQKQLLVALVCAPASASDNCALTAEL
jgi:N-acetylglutamate synthase-like GNAT family acetyltransferase